MSPCGAVGAVGLCEWQPVGESPACVVQGGSAARWSLALYTLSVWAPSPLRSGCFCRVFDLPEGLGSFGDDDGPGWAYVANGGLLLVLAGAEECPDVDRQSFLVHAGGVPQSFHGRVELAAVLGWENTLLGAGQDGVKEQAGSYQTPLMGLFVKVLRRYRQG